MKKIGLALGLLALLVGGFLLMGRPASAPEVSQQPAAKLRFSTIAQEVSKNSAVLLDVRTAQEYTSGHFQGARNLSLQDLQAGTLPSVAKDTPLYVYCHSGNRSGQATTLLKNAGFTNVTDLGGLSNIQAMGGTLIQ